MKRLTFWICLLACCYVTAQSIIRPPSGTLRIEGHLVVTNRTSGLATNVIEALSNIAGGTATNAMVSINLLTNAYQTLVTSTAGTDFGITSSGSEHTFELPTASAVKRGALNASDWILFNAKQAPDNYITALTGDVAATGPGSATVAIQPNAVTLSKLAGNSVDSSKIVDSSITGSDILDSTITEFDISDSSVTSAKIEDGSILTIDLANSSVTLAKMAVDSVNSSKVVDRGVVDVDIEYAVIPKVSAAGTVTFDFNGPRRQTNSESGSLTVAIANKPTTSVDRWFVAQFTPATTLTLTWPTTVSGSVARWIPDATNAVTSIAAGTFREIAIGWNGVQVLFADMCGVTGGGTVDYASVTNALALTGSTSTFLRSDGTQATPTGGGSGNMVNTGANVVGTIPRASDTSSTNYAPSVLNVGTTGNTTIGDSSQASLTFEWPLSGASDPLLTISNGLITETGSFTASANLTAQGNVTTGASGGYFFGTSRSQMASPVNGELTLMDSTGATFSLLNFGGTTASFPALKRTNTSLAFMLADESGYTDALFSSVYVTNSVMFEGSVDDAFEGSLIATNITGVDKQWILPNKTGTFIISGDNLVGDVTLLNGFEDDGTSSAVISANAVALTTDTTGNYVSGLTGTANEITVSHTPSEGSTGTFSLPTAITLTGKTLTGGTFITALMDDYFDINEESVPGTPATAKVRVYAKADGLLYSKDDAGVETALGGGISDADLSAIAALTGTGIPARTATDTWALRTITAGNQMSMSNGDGVAGNPTPGVLTNPTFTTLDTGQGANELYDMDQNVLITSDVTFNSITATTLNVGTLNLTNKLARSLITNGTPSKLVYNDPSTGLLSELHVGSGLAISGTNLTASAAGIAGTMINATTPVTLYELFRAKDTTGSNAEPAMLTYNNATLVLGTNAAAPANKLITGSVPTGANTVGASLDIQSPSGTGTAAGGPLRLSVSPAGASSSVTNPAVTGLTLAVDAQSTATVATTVAGRLRISDGTVALPSIVFTSDDDSSGLGLYRYTANSIGFAGGGGAVMASLSMSAFALVPPLQLGGISSTTLAREATDIIQFNTDASSPSSPTFKGPDGSGSTIAAGNTKFGPGRSTGGAVPGIVQVEVGTTGASASSQNAYATAVGIGGTLKVDTTTTGNVGSGEDDLIPYTIAAGQLSKDGSFIEFDVAGTFANNANTAQVKLYFDGAAFFDSTSLLFGSTSLIWRATGKIIRTGAATQKIVGDFGVSGTLLGSLTTTTRFYATDTATLSGATIFKVTGQDTDGVPADNKVVQEAMILKWFPGQ